MISSTAILPLPVLSEGGEGVIYALPDRRTLAKVYRPAARTDFRTHKVSWMVAHRVTGSLARSVAWPDEAIHENGRVVGFTMTRFDAKPLNALLSNDQCFKVPYLTRVKICRSIAATTAALHGSGYAIVGDLHADNFGYTDTGDTYLYDADSLQITAGRRKFPCTVCHDDCRPPELASVDLSATAALSESTDNYMLGNLVFRLLIGAHPYAGVDTSMSAAAVSSGVPNAVTDGEFVFELNPAEVPKWAASYELVGCLRPLFRRCFVEGARDPSARPSALEWVNGLDILLSESMRKCPKHGEYPSRLQQCPFCTAKPPTRRVAATSPPSRHQIPVLLRQNQPTAAKALAQVPVANQPTTVKAVAQAPVVNQPTTSDKVLKALKVIGIALAGLAATAAVVLAIALFVYALPYLLVGALVIGLIGAIGSS